jgi:N-acetylglucosaminyldiphosphoundecaprenol N-acetyl-beta-D-mannosaminyltransferase
MTMDPSDPAARPWRRIALLGVAADDLTMDETIDVVDRMIADGSVNQHVVINVSKVVQADRDPALGDLITSCDLISVDGQPILWAARFLGTPLRSRVAGVDLMERLIERAGERHYRLYLLGAREPVVRAVADRIARDHPGAQVVGWRDGYWSPPDEPDVVAAIVQADPDILFVAIGSPAKERFLARWKDDIGVPFVMGVGGSFDVYAGTIRRAPRWMQRVGLEWLFRVAQEPGRMWRRYAGDAPRFARIVLRARLSRRGPAD